MNRFSLKGAGLTVITGPMRSGKSHELIRYLSEVPYGGLRAMVFKPASDSRQDGVRSRMGAETDAVSIARVSDIYKYVQDVDVVGFDEGQFFSLDLVEVVLDLIRQGKHVCIAGLNLDKAGRPFGPIPPLMPYATQIDVRSAYCERCKGEASRTHRTTEDGGQFVVGDSIYQSLCIPCFEGAIAHRNKRNMTLQEKMSA